MATFYTGQLVQRSNHWCEQHGGCQEDQLGIVVGYQSSWEGEDHPVVHWEGEVLALPVHPLNLEPVDRTGLRISAKDG